MLKRITAILFLIIIFVFGIGTVFKLLPAFKESVRLSFDKKSIAEVNSLIDLNVKSRNNWIDLNGGFHRLLGMSYVRDPGNIDVYKLQNGQLIYNLEKQDMKWYVRNITKLHHYISNSGNGPMLYVQLPFKAEDDSIMPAGVNEYGNDNADELLAGLKRTGVPTLDIRRVMHEEEVGYDKAFITTDQHWTPQTARWTAGKICSYSREKFDLPNDSSLFDAENWNTKTYKEWFLGSLGKRTGRLYGGVSDFDILTPKIDTEFDFEAKSLNKRLHRHGTFEKALLDMKNIRTKELFSLNPYAAYIGGDYKINTVLNSKADNECSVLLVRDSFSCAMQPFLCMNYRKVTAIDLRHYDDGTLKDHLKENKYDLILVAYNPSAFSKIQFTFK